MLTKRWLGGIGVLRGVIVSHRRLVRPANPGLISLYSIELPEQRSYPLRPPVAETADSSQMVNITMSAAATL